MDPPLALERYAELSAEIDAGTPRDQVLAKAGITLDSWLLVQQAWLGRFGAEAVQRKFETSRRFQALYCEHRRNLAGRGVGRVPTKAPTSRPFDAPPSSEARPPASEQRAPTPPSAPAVPAPPLAAGYGGAQASAGPRLTLPQYASLCVELTMYPQTTEAIRVRYGFDQAMLDREHHEWRWRFEQDPTLYQQYGALFQRYREWLLGSARSAG